MRCARLEDNLLHCLDPWSAFQELIEDLIRRLAPIDPAERWPVLSASGLHIGDVTAGDFAFKLANISWRLVTADYASLNGGVGAVVSTFRGNDWQDPSDWLCAAEAIEADAFLKYMQLHGGAAYLVLHETAHTTKLGLQTNNQQFDRYLSEGGNRYDGAAWAASAHWLYNEQVANAVALAASRRLRVDILESPTCGLPGARGAPTRTSEIV
jgi:hypothetical protein